MSAFMKLQQMRQNYFTPSVTIPKEFKQKNEENVPKYFCKTCTKCSNKYCSFFNRRVDPKYNRCFNHSNYHPVATSYVSPVNIKEIALANEEKQIA